MLVLETSDTRLRQFYTKWLRIVFRYQESRVEEDSRLFDTDHFTSAEDYRLSLVLTTIVRPSTKCSTLRASLYTTRRFSYSRLV